MSCAGCRCRARAAPVPLESVADLQILDGPAELTRQDRRRNVKFRVELNGQSLGVVQDAAARLPRLSRLPRGVAVLAAGDAEVMGELIAGFILATLAGALCIYIVLVLLLRDFAQPPSVLGAPLLAVPGDH